MEARKASSMQALTSLDVRLALHSLLFAPLPFLLLREARVLTGWGFALSCCALLFVLSSLAPLAALKPPHSLPNDRRRQPRIRQEKQSRDVTDSQASSRDQSQFDGCLLRSRNTAATHHAHARVAGQSGLRFANKYFNSKHHTCSFVQQFLMLPRPLRLSLRSLRSFLK